MRGTGVVVVQMRNVHRATILRAGPNCNGARKMGVGRRDEAEAIGIMRFRSFGARLCSLRCWQSRLKK